MGVNPTAGPLIMLAIPTFGSVDFAWAQAYKQLAQPLGSLITECADRSPMDIASKRNFLVQRALDIGAQNILFIGDDVIIPPMLILQMLQRRRMGAQIITGVYWSKTYPPQPYIWKGFLTGAFYDWHVGDYFQIDWAGCDCLMINTAVFRQIEPPWFSLEYKYHQGGASGCNGTEDLYFFGKVKEAGIPVWCDAGIQCGHIDRGSGIVFTIPFDYPQAKLGSEIPRKHNLLIADIGCGYRQSQGHLEGDVVRFDANPNVKPDVLCDVRKIPDMDEKYDVVTASHILEHIPANETLTTLAEWARILKTGGKIIIEVPNAGLAMQRVIEGQQTPYHHLMIWGQQTDGMYHFNGFTPEILRNAINCLGNLEIKDLRLTSNPEPGAEIVLEAIKVKPKTVPALSVKFGDEQATDCLTGEPQGSKL